jgi:hypothetical protein
VEVGQFVDERQLRAAVVHRVSRASSRAASRVNSGVDLALLHEQEQQQLEDEQVEEAAEEEDARQQPQQNGTAAHQTAEPAAAAPAPAGRRTSGGSARKQPKQPIEYMVPDANLGLIPRIYCCDATLRLQLPLQAHAVAAALLTVCCLHVVCLCVCAG